MRQEQITTDLLNKVKEIEKDATRYRKLKELISYENGEDGMQWASMDWCIDPVSLTPSTLDEAIDIYLA